MANDMFYNHVVTGVLVIFGGIMLIILSWIFQSFNLPDIFLGYFTGPLVIIIGGGILVRGEDKKD